MNEEKILDSIIKEYSWETVLYNIVIAEDMDPWDIDIVKLADAFAKYVEKMKEMDFRVPAKVILAASVFLRMKSEALRLQDEEEEEEDDEDEEELDVSDVPDIDKPSQRRPVRKVTIDELAQALEKAFEIKEKKEVRRKTEDKKVIEIEEDDINRRIEDLYDEITGYINEEREKKIKYSQITESKGKEEAVRTFLPLLHLIQEGKITAEQEDLFKEIYIYLKENEEDENDEQGREEESD